MSRYGNFNFDTPIFQDKPKYNFDEDEPKKVEPKKEVPAKAEFKVELNLSHILIILFIVLAIILAMEYANYQQLNMLHSEILRLIEYKK